MSSTRQSAASAKPAQDRAKPARDRAKPAQNSQPTPRVRYVYGISTSGAEVPPGLQGVGDPASRVTLVRYRHIAAITSAISVTRPLGTAVDLRAHASVLNAMAALGAVLPMRFGGVLADREAVTAELLEPFHDEFAGHLERLDGHEQFTIKGKYVGDTALREVLMAEPDALRLREVLRSTDSEAYREDRIRLGEIVSRALDRKRSADTDALIGQLAPHAVAVAEPAPAGTAGPGPAVRASFLVRRTRRSRFERAAEELGRRWDGRIRLRMVGPVAPYDFAEPMPAGA